MVFTETTRQRELKHHKSANDAGKFSINKILVWEPPVPVLPVTSPTLLAVPAQNTPLDPPVSEVARESLLFCKLNIIFLIKTGIF